MPTLAILGCSVTQTTWRAPLRNVAIVIESRLWSGLASITMMPGFVVEDQARLMVIEAVEARRLHDQELGYGTGKGRQSCAAEHG